MKTETSLLRHTNCASSAAPSCNQHPKQNDPPSRRVFLVFSLFLVSLICVKAAMNQDGEARRAIDGISGTFPPEPLVKALGLASTRLVALPSLKRLENMHPNQATRRVAMQPFHDTIAKHPHLSFEKQNRSFIYVPFLCEKSHLCLFLFVQSVAHTLIYNYVHVLFYVNSANMKTFLSSK